jgi:hypothetical protein
MNMNKKTMLRSFTVAMAVSGGLAASAITGYGQGAVATISDVPVSGGYDYTITLENTGSTLLNSFWYGWTTSGNNLPADPSTAGNNLGWNNDLDGNSIMWVNSSGTTLAAGNSGTFSFFSISSPAAITAPPAGESVAYVNGIDFSEGSAGHSTGVFSPTVVAIPEPSPAALLALGSLGLLALRCRKMV